MDSVTETSSVERTKGTSKTVVIKKRGPLLSFFLGKKESHEEKAATFDQKHQTRRRRRFVFRLSITFALAVVIGTWALRNRSISIEPTPGSFGVSVTAAVVNADGTVSGNLRLDGRGQLPGAKVEVDLVLLSSGETVFRHKLGSRDLDAGITRDESFHLDSVAALSQTKGQLTITPEVRRTGPLPVAAWTLSAPGGEAPFTLQADASSSQSPSGTPLSFTWYLDGQQAGVGPKAVMTISKPGGHEVKVVVADAIGRAEKSETVQVNEPERIIDVTCFVRTSDDDKECGGWRVRLTQGGRDIFDHTWGYGENWDNHSERRFVTPLDQSLASGPIIATSSIEERPGEVRINWGVELMQVTIRTNKRQLVFQRQNFTHKSRGDGGNLKSLDIPSK